jgi:Protein of unknown function (DUF3180)
MSAAVLTCWAIIGLVVGWGYHRIIDHGTSPAPLVSWSQPLALFLVACILGGTAWSTQRAVNQHVGRLPPHHAVNRLVLARACAYVGCLVAGLYFGYAVSWVGVDSDLAAQRGVRSAIAGAAGVLIVVTALLLERACRVPPDKDES